jgi:hypothetical protein
MSKARQATDAPRFSRQWWIDSVKISVWVVIVTVLVWVYADMEFTQTADVALTVRLNTDGSKEAVLTSENPIREVTFQLRGSRSDLDKFVKKFRGQIVDLDLSSRPGFRPGLDQEIDSVDVLENVSEVTELGLRVVSGRPAKIRDINVEKLEPRNLPVEFIYKGVELDVVPIAEVEVKAPESRWGVIPGKSSIRTIEKDLTDLPIGEPQDVSFQLIAAIGAEPVELAKSEMTVSVKVVRRTAAATETIPITVRIVSPAEWSEEGQGVWTQYTLVRKDRIEWRTKITVTGPRKDIDILKTDKTKTIDAYIILTDSDTEPIDSWSSRPVTLRFPPDLQIQLASGQTEPTVQFRLEKRAAVTP